MAPPTLQMLSDARDEIDALDAEIIAEAPLGSVRDKELTAMRLQDDLQIMTRQYHVHDHMSKPPQGDGDWFLVPGVKRKVPDDPRELVSAAKRFDRGFILVSEDGEWMIPDCDKDAKTYVRAWPSVPADGRRALDAIANLLVNQEGRSITHRPKQMDRVFITIPGNKQRLFDAITTGIRNLQDDTTVLGHAIMALWDGTITSDTVPGLVSSLERTYGPAQLRRVYATEGGESMTKILEQLGGEDHAAQDAMLLRLLHSAVVLRKYTCLATALAVAVAPKLGQTRSDDRRPAVRDPAIERCLNLYRKLRAMYAAKLAGGAPPLHMSSLTIDYNPDNEVRDTLERDLVKDRLNKLGQLQGVDCDLAKLLGSTGYGAD